MIPLLTSKAALHRLAALLCAAMLLLAIQVWRGQTTSPLALAATTPAQDPTTLTPMPFEQPGNSFPGSAYYYLSYADETPNPQWNSQALQPDTGPIARAITGLSAPQDRARALACLTAAIYYEAASEPDDGQRAVAQVVLNRLAHPAFPKTVCGVVFQGSERTTGCQFTFTCDGALARQPSRYFWDRAEKVARAALAGYVFPPAGLATHYHTFAVHPVWADSLNFINQIGAHRFYRLTGPAGDQATFRFTYSGGEPLPLPHPRSAIPRPDATSDPIAIEHAYATNLRPTSTSDATHRATPLPGTVRPEYQNSGRWISDPQ